MESLEFSIYNHVICEWDNFTSSFQNWNWEFIAQWLWLALSILCWMVVVIAGILVLFQMLRMSLAIEYDVSCGFFIYGLFSSVLLRVFFFYHKCVWNFIKCIFASIWNDRAIFLPSPVNVQNYMNWFSKVNQLCIPGINPTLSWCIILFIIPWTLLD